LRFGDIALVTGRPDGEPERTIGFAQKQPLAGVYPPRLLCQGLGARSSPVCALSRWTSCGSTWARGDEATAWRGEAAVADRGL